jgi:hypothetical protein
VTVEQRYRASGPDIVHEIIDGEAVIVNLGNGTYYSTAGAGAEIWALLEQRAATPAIVGALERRYGAAPGVIEAAVAAFLAELETEGLIAPDDEPGPEDHVEAPASTGRSPFAPPTLSKYSDMEDLLLLDPVRETDRSA